ncbi:MAG TPA: glycosyltransferase family 4 protein [Acidimicrobiales bacterium]
MIDTIHQIVPTLSPGDAVGSHTLAVRDALRAAGLRSEIFSDDVHPDLSADARPLDALPAPGTSGLALVYQLSIGNEIVDRLMARPEPLIVDYHNLTPVAQLLRWAPDMAHLAGWGRGQLGDLAARSVLGIGDSAFNVEDLRAAGFARTAVVPILLDVDDLRHQQPERAERHGRRWLFVGRVVPNKAQHDIVLALAWYRAVHDPDAELHLIGRDAAPAYTAALRDLIAELDLRDAVKLVGGVDDARLAREYAEADVFVCLSDHEGFCIPVLEAMANDLPVVAYASSALPETVGSGGLLLPRKDPATVAVAVHRLATDDALRAAMVERGATRVQAFDRSRTAPLLLEALSGALDLTER